MCRARKTEMAERMKKGLAGLLCLILTGCISLAQAFDLRATSYGPMRLDYATRRYYVGDHVSRYQEGDPLPNIWLRLDSRESLEELNSLTDFRVIKGRAMCGVLPVPLLTADMNNDWGRAYFRPMAGFNRAALDIRLEEGEKLGNVTIACQRQLKNGQTETLILPLKKVKLDMLYPKGGLRLSAGRFSPFRFERFPDWSALPATLGNILEYEANQHIPGLPERISELPWDSQAVQLFLIEGKMLKKTGFPVFDVLFSAQNPPEGFYLAEYQHCASCSEIDDFDMGEQCREKDFAILLLVEPLGRSEAEIEGLIKALEVTASFSVEQWNILHEQHLTTTGIGPRSEEAVQMAGITKGK